MTDRTRHSGLRRLWHAGLLGCLAMVALALGPGKAAAQSAYDCRALEVHGALPAIEGREGVFFRIDPDMRAYQTLSDESIALIGELSRALRSRGTTLVLMPVPGRGHVLAHQLPAMAQHVGFDPDIATAVHRDVMQRLAGAGIAVADPRRALRQSALAGRMPFFAADPRPTAEGSKVMAASIADILAQHPDTKDLARGQFLTQPVGAVTLPSVMRAQLQLACQDTLPTVAFAAETTRPDGPVSDSVGVAAVIGTEFTGTAALNFSGYLSAASGLRVLGYGVAGGGAFAAMSSYLTSVDFRAAPPQVLVWEFPLWTSLANHGDQPMKELIAAGGESCSRPLTLGPGSGPGRVVADLQGLDAGQDVTLALDTDGAFVSAVRFHFRGADDLVRPRSIYRHPDQLLTGRFYMPLSGLEATGLRSVEIEIPQPYGPQPSLTACIRGATK